MEWAKATTANATIPVLSADGMERLRAIYPNSTGTLTHCLVDHPLLSLEQLALAAERMNPAHVECRVANGQNGGEFAMAVPLGESPAETIRQIDRAGRWVMLRFAEQLPEYAELIDALLAQMKPVMDPTTGDALKVAAFIFISSPGTLTPFHFDPEYNILFQIAGNKRFATFPLSEPWLPRAQREQFHRLEDNLLPWDEGYRSGEVVHQLRPGDAIFVPYKVPHWVQVDDQPSISISLTWKSAGSIEHDLAWHFNDWLRAKGLDPQPPRQPPHRPWFRAKAMRLLQRMGMG